MSMIFNKSGSHTDENLSNEGNPQMHLPLKNDHLLNVYQLLTGY